MQPFELCFQIPNTSEFVIPELLSEEVPEAVHVLFPSHIPALLHFEYCYEFMPKGLITRFICQVHKLVKEQLFWRSGVVLTYQQSEALITCSVPQHKIDIVIKGPERKELLNRIREHFSSIHVSFKNLVVQQKVPCICKTCQQSDSPHFYAYSKLLARQTKGKKTAECLKSFQQIMVEQLLAEVQTPRTDKYFQELIAEGKLNQALSELQIGFAQYDEIILILSNWHDLKKQQTSGTITDQEFTVKKTKIEKRVLSFIGEFNSHR